MCILLLMYRMNDFLTCDNDSEEGRFSLKIEFGLNITRKYSENVSSLADTVGIVCCSGGFHPSPFLNDILKMNYVKKIFVN